MCTTKKIFLKPIPHWKMLTVLHSPTYRNKMTDILQIFEKNFSKDYFYGHNHIFVVHLGQIVYNSACSGNRLALTSQQSSTYITWGPFHKQFMGSWLKSCENWLRFNFYDPIKSQYFTCSTVTDSRGMCKIVTRSYSFSPYTVVTCNLTTLG